ncbi:hypothetical protein EDD86DRAFT_277185 [Gorgonomyces haynaldii]|nr:hypothetical protein EDD86DRAFT_277185 [Gorgonomyces haynaldii]
MEPANMLQTRSFRLPLKDTKPSMKDVKSQSFSNTLQRDVSNSRRYLLSTSKVADIVETNEEDEIHTDKPLIEKAIDLPVPEGVKMIRPSVPHDFSNHQSHTHVCRTFSVHEMLSLKQICIRTTGLGKSNRAQFLRSLVDRHKLSNDRYIKKPGCAHTSLGLTITGSPSDARILRSTDTFGKNLAYKEIPRLPKPVPPVTKTPAAVGPQSVEDIILSRVREPQPYTDPPRIRFPKESVEISRNTRYSANHEWHRKTFELVQAPVTSHFYMDEKTRHQKVPFVPPTKTIKKKVLVAR